MLRHDGIGLQVKTARLYGLLIIKELQQSYSVLHVLIAVQKCIYIYIYIYIYTLK